MEWKKGRTSSKLPADGDGRKDGRTRRQRRGRGQGGKDGRNGMEEKTYFLETPDGR
jgi:hypothetical protein